MKVYVDFTRPDKPFQPLSWVIRKFQRTEYSHVRIRWTNTVGQQLIFEASGRKIKLIGEKALYLYPTKIVKNYKIELTKHEYRQLIKLFKYSSLDYGIIQLLGIPLVYVFNLKKNPFAKGKKSQVCSELIGIFFKEVKDWDFGLDLDTAGPKQIEKALNAKINQGFQDIEIAENGTTQ